MPPAGTPREREFDLGFLWPSLHSPLSCAVTNDRLRSMTPPSTSLDLGAVSGTQDKDGSGSHPHIPVCSERCRDWPKVTQLETLALV